MTTPSKTSSAAQTYQLISDKRQALEKLIKIASGVHDQQSALSELAYASRPSQEFPKKVVKYFAAVEERMQEFDSASVVKRLESLEKITEQNLRKMLRLASVDINQLRANEIESLSPESFKEFIDGFKRRTKTSLAIRYLLKKRGLAIEPFHLPVSQDTVNHQIKQLKEKEKNCVRQVRSEINDIIKDSNGLLALPDLAEPIKEELKSVVSGMHANLEHLDKGGSISSMPNVFEIITLQSETYESIEEEPETNEKETISNAAREAPTQVLDALPDTEVKPAENKSFLWLLKTWLSSPWKTSWRSLKEKNRSK